MVLPDEQVEEDKPDEQVEEDKPDEQVEEDKPDTTIKAEELDETDYESMSVSQIKKMLREKGLSRSGRKAVLITRLRD